MSGSTEYRLTWRASVTPSGRRICRLRASGRRTSDSGCFGWPTSAATDGTKAPKKYAGGNPSLPGAAQMVCPSLAGWPTCKGTDCDNGQRSPEGAAREFVRKGEGADLPTMATLPGWPSPMTPNGGRNGMRTEPGREGKVRSLESVPKLIRDAVAGPDTPTSNEKFQVAVWPTPSAREFEHRDAERMMERRAEQKAMGRNGNGFGLTLGMMAPSSFIAPTAKRVLSRLNPGFSLWLMGYPASWTACSPGWQSAAWVERTLAEYYASRAATGPGD